MNHHMFSSIGAWYYWGLAGMRILSPGFKAVLIKPWIPENLPRFAAWHNTPVGRLSFGWDQDSVMLEVPQNMKAFVQMGGKKQVVAPGKHVFQRKEFLVSDS